MPQILVVEDDDAIRELVSDVLRDDGYEVRRHSDRSVLPATFPLDDLRVEHP